jgi:hypothetical protein
MSPFDSPSDIDTGSSTDADERATSQHAISRTARVVEGEFDIEPLRACRRRHAPAYCSAAPTAR